MRFLVLLLMAAAGRLSLLSLYQEALDLWAGGDAPGARERFAEIHARMPHDLRAAFNLAALFGEGGAWEAADSLMAALPPGNLGADTLFHGEVSAALGRAMGQGDYGEVLLQYERLLPRVASGQGDSLARHNYEVALRWLTENEPPPDPEQEQDPEQDPEQEQEQDPEQEQEQDPEQEQEQDPEQEQEQEQEQDPEQEQETQQPPPPETPEMNREEAQRILDMVEEADPGVEKESTGPGSFGVPHW